MIELDSICREALRRRQAGEDLFLATVVRIEGSSYRRPGAHMLVGRDRWLSGCVSAGCLEDDLVRRGEFRLGGAGAVLNRYDSTSDDDIGWGFGVGCNGVVEVLIERLGDANETDPLRFAARCFEREQEGVIATVFASDDVMAPVGARLLVRGGVAEASSLSRELEHALRARANELEKEGAGRTWVVAYGGIEVFIERVHPVPHVFVVGSRHDARPLLEMARSVGLRVTVVDRGVSITTRERFRDADRLVSASPSELRRLVDAHHTPLAVVMTHDYERDRDYLGALLGTKARYIGVLGPARRTSKMLAELAVGGIVDSAPSEERLHAPAGLALGAETPREIAVSIVSEMQATLTGASAGRLRSRGGPIHGAPEASRSARASQRRGVGIAAVVLAAGASTRLGRPKQLLVRRGEPLVSEIARLLLATPKVTRVGVVTGSAHESVEAAVRGLAVDIVSNAEWQEGMASSIRAATRWAEALGADGLLIAIVDQVRLTVAHLEALVDAWSEGTPAVASGYGGTLGVPAVFDARSFRALLTLEGDRGAAKLIRSLEGVVVVPWEEGLVDVDTEEDVARVASSLPGSSLK